eukprot:TRINITY_DN29491_c0_g2_i1.p1 TRINITY_DN29491_c0_g2~~TRINITY_DN29491_c0_g2_i1.p1  ORF type:complete len:226 (-),score=33.70 TRINITY_DN29491_c0_g2_i1:188-865(-)
MASGSPSLHVSVLAVSGTTVFSAEVSNAETVYGIKELLHAEAGTPPPRWQALMKDGRQLAHECILGDEVDTGDNELNLTVIYTSLRMERIGVRSGALIDQISFHYSDGTCVTRGMLGGGAREPFVLDAGEFLQEIRFRKGDSLDALQLISSTGRESAWCGNTRGGRGPFSLKAQPGMQIWSVERRGGWRGCGTISELIELPIHQADWSATDWKVAEALISVDVSQ